MCVGIFFQNKVKTICNFAKKKKNSRIILAAKIILNKGKFQGREFPYLSVTGRSGPDLKVQTG